MPEGTAVIEAPAAAPATESAAPAAEATPVETSIPTDVKGQEDILSGKVNDVIKGLNIDGVEKPAEAKPPVEAAKPIEKTPEELEAEKVAEEAKAATEAAKTEEEKKPEVVEPNPLDKIGPLPVEKLADTLKNNPALAAELEKAGLDPEVLYETSRQAALAEQFMEAGLPTPEAAKYAVENANHFYDLEEKFPAIKTIEDFSDFAMNTLLPLTFIRDPKTGEPIKNPDGTFQTDGSYARFQKLTVDYENQSCRDQIAPGIIAEGKRTGNEEMQTFGEQLQAAYDFIEEFRNNNYKMPGQKPAELSPEHKAEMDRLRARDQVVTQRENAVREEQVVNLETSVSADTEAWIRPIIRDNINETSLSDYEKKHVANEIDQEILSRLNGDRTFGKLKEGIWKRLEPGENDEAIRKELVALNKTTTNAFLKRAVQGILHQAGARQIAASTKKHDKIVTQINADRGNPGATAAARSTAPPTMTDDEAFNADIETARTANGGKTPSTQQIIAATLKRKGIGQTA